jgi:two-component system LytT family response regulator
MVRVGDRMFIIRTAQIDWIEAEGNYVRVHAGKESSLLRRPIGRLESVLDPRRFLRVNRSAIVNLDSVREVKPLFHGEYSMLLQGGAELKLSRKQRQKFHQMVGMAT